METASFPMQTCRRCSAAFDARMALCPSCGSAKTAMGNHPGLAETLRIKGRSDDLCRQAMDCMVNENWEPEAIPLLRQAIEINPMNERAYQELAFAWRRIGARREATELLTHLLNFSPRNDSARRLLEAIQSSSEASDAPADDRVPPSRISEASANLLREMSTEQVKSLYRRNCGLHAFATLFCLFAALSFVLFLAASLGELRKTPGGSDAGPMIGTAFAALLCGLSGLGTVARIRAARFFCMLVLAVMLLGIPIGTAIGVLGLLTYSGSEPLFGSRRLRGNELAAELERRKAQK